MDDLDFLEDLNINHGGIPRSDDTDSLPPGFRETLPGLTTGHNSRAAHVAAIRQLIDQLDSADNQVVKSQKRRTLRAELNALHLIDDL